MQKWKIGMIVSASRRIRRPLDRHDHRADEMAGTGTQAARSRPLAGRDRSYKSFGTATQMIVGFPPLADGKAARAVLTVEVTRHTLLPPDETDPYVVPDAKSLPPEFKPYLNPSPLIESNHPRIKALAKQLGEGQAKAWDRVRAIYDWVRKTIHYRKNAPLTGCLEAIDKQSGDCNQLTSTFIAICRASGIPARTVQIPGHCYPEFYLNDEKGEGHWFPAEVSGTEDFGGVFTHTPILQKGDAFQDFGARQIAAAKEGRGLPPFAEQSHQP